MEIATILAKKEARMEHINKANKEVAKLLGNKESQTSSKEIARMHGTN